MATFAGNSSAHKRLADFSFYQQLKKEQALSSTGFSVPNPLFLLPNLQTGGSFPICYGNKLNSNNNISDEPMFSSQYFGPNGGSLVLDSDRGELVNASKMTLKEISEAKALAASKNHSEAERRRRERINSHLATLKNLLPSVTKTDKASLLAEVINHVNDLKQRVAEISKTISLPTDVDEVRVETDEADEEGKILIKASLCCEDRPYLMTDLIQTFHTLGLRTVKAEICTLAGRVKNVFLVINSKGKSEENGETISVNCIEEALRVVMERAPVSSEFCIGRPTSNKR